MISARCALTLRWIRPGTAPSALAFGATARGGPADAHLAIHVGHHLVFDLVGEQGAQQGDASGDPCLRTLQADLVYVNTLILQAVLAEPQ